MKVALIQQTASTDRKANLATGLASFEKAAESGADLVCFAELAFDPFFPQDRAKVDVSHLAEPIPGPMTDAFVSKAAELGVVVVLNMFERGGGHTYDTSPVIDADGKILGKTRMVHIPDYACFHEQDYYTPGDTGAPVYETAVGRVGVAICYDRHYPEYMRALSLAGAELVVVPQAGVVDEWPDDLFEAEMRVAAFQNGYFIALCNRVGLEPKLEFSGESFVCNPEGGVVARAGKGIAEVLMCDLDLSQTKVSHARKLFHANRRPDLYGEWLT
ncbi:MAG: carbon-nitrogen hydrolase family protein [Gemmatimonadetes bacterium]|nr:carbon-nitrogen hydrolase family protein [Gemmatimonadota bacterium]